MNFLLVDNNPKRINYFQKKVILEHDVGFFTSTPKGLRSIRENFHINVVYLLSELENSDDFRIVADIVSIAHISSRPEKIFVYGENDQKNEQIVYFLIRCGVYASTISQKDLKKYEEN